MIDKDESRRIRAEVRRVLLDVWDPIESRTSLTLRTSTIAAWVRYFSCSRLARQMTRLQTTCGDKERNIWG
jgi:hypothetical protein